MARPHRTGGKAAAAPVFREVVSFTPDPLPVRYYDQDTTKPVSFYLSSLEDVLAWTPSGEDSFNVALEPRACRQPPLDSPRPRTLLCHDMMGGYLDDRFIQGCGAQQPYCFYHWQYIDIFVYFSHHLATIPPVGWTNCAHRHGVCVLGTFITEWKDGSRLCESFLAGDQRSYQAVADQLVRIARFFGFDGWLINIENSLSPAAVGNLPGFLRYLTSELHREVPGGQVLWYDSVLRSGQLQWQDELNEHNRVFLDACDGFFTNYNWAEEHLQRTRVAAGPRLADVYVGVDVFGRGKVVGGGFNTVKSLELIRKHDLSAALFAPGWVYERLEKADFFQNQDRFWGLLVPHLPTHSVCSLPFVTSFCLGLGTRRVCYGQEEAVGPWYHASAQELQPLYGEHRPEGGGPGWVKTLCCLADSWHGGSSLLVQGRIPAEAGSVAVRLFTLHVPVPPKLLLSLVYKLEGPASVDVALELTTGDVGTCHVGGISVLADARLRPRPLPVPPSKLARWVGHCGQQLSGGWTQRCYEATLQGCVLRDLCVRFSRLRGSRDEDFACRLGEVQVLDANSLRAPLAQVQAVAMARVCWQRAAAGGRLLLSCTLHWSHPLAHARHYRVHCRGGGLEPDKPTMLGLAFANQYRVVGLVLAALGPGQEARVDFLVEPVPREGFRVPEAEWGRAGLLYTMPGTPQS